MKSLSKNGANSSKILDDKNKEILDLKNKLNEAQASMNSVDQTAGGSGARIITKI